MIGTGRPVPAGPVSWLARLTGVAGLALSLSACGSSGDDANALTVAAASSLTEAFESYSTETGQPVRFSFGGSDELAAQIRSGARPDVYAAAEVELPEELHREGLVGKPIVFATNELVLAVPAQDATIQRIADLAQAGTDLVIGASGVPIGDYARQVLGRLPQDETRAILANVRSEEPDAKSIVAKLTVGAADAGLIYASDAIAAGDALRSVGLPRRLQPQVAYAAAVVEGSEDPDGARRFIDGLRSVDGAAVLKSAGFGPPPR